MNQTTTTLLLVEDAVFHVTLACHDEKWYVDEIRGPSREAVPCVGLPASPDRQAAIDLAGKHIRAYDEAWAQLLL